MHLHYSTYIDLQFFMSLLSLIFCELFEDQNYIFYLCISKIQHTTSHFVSSRKICSFKFEHVFFLPGTGITMSNIRGFILVLKEFNILWMKQSLVERKNEWTKHAQWQQLDLFYYLDFEAVLHCSPGWPWTQDSPASALLSVGILRVCHHAQLAIRPLTQKSMLRDIFLFWY
jgi:hypothetical protein